MLAIILTPVIFLMTWFTFNWTFLICLLASGALCYLLISRFRKLLLRYSAEGKRLLAEVEGLKLYISAAESSRIEFFNPPGETPEVFERLLPWAFALGLAKTWRTDSRGCLIKRVINPNGIQCVTDWGFIGCHTAVITVAVRIAGGIQPIRNIDRRSPQTGRPSVS